MKRRLPLLPALLILAGCLGPKESSQLVPESPFGKAAPVRPVQRAAHQPADLAQVVIHNDFRFDNVVLNPDNPFEVIGVLDWEMATIGDPLMDLGNSLAYWIEADDEAPFQMLRRQPTHRPGMLTRKEVVAYYMERSGFHADRFDFYEIYGLFRLAVIIQQIYYRYYHGQTKDKRFAQFIHMNRLLEHMALQVIDKSSL